MKSKHAQPLVIAFIFCLCLMFLSSSHSVAQVGDSSIVVKGYVMDSETLADLNRVHVFNSKGNITISDIKGFFRLRVAPNDTLTFSRIDYEKKTLIITRTGTSDLIVTLKQKTYILDTVDIFGEYTVPSYLLKPEKKPANIEGVTRYVNPEKDYHLGVGGSLASPATAIYQLFSKRYKEEKKAYALEKQDAKEDEVREEAYARIDDILELEEVELFDEEYDLLVEHCHLNLDWVAQSNSYDLYLRMKDCLKSFLNKEGIKKE